MGTKQQTHVDVDKRVKYVCMGVGPGVDPTRNDIVLHNIIADFIPTSHLDVQRTCYYQPLDTV